MEQNMQNNEQNNRQNRMSVQLWNSFKIACSMYSRIPMPKSDWTDANMKYAMCFFPFVGCVIGAVCGGWIWLSSFWGLPETWIRVILLVLLPVLVSGGIHMDGLMDTEDALRSYQGMEKRLEILKDPRAGAFAILAAIVYLLLSLGVCDLLLRGKGSLGLQAVLVFLVTFVVSRSLSALAVVSFPKAKNTGLASAFSDASQKKTVRVTMVFWLLAALSFAAAVNWIFALGILVAALLVFAGYYRMAMSKFGGITGDLAGWFLQYAELAMAAITAVLLLVLQGGLLWY